MFALDDRRLAAGRRAVIDRVPLFHEGFGRVASQWKEDGTRVTAADKAISEAVFADLSRQFPEDDFCSEESEPEGGGHDLRARCAWVLDPIDGTNNYALGLPACAISLALLVDGVPAYGWVYDGARRQLMEGGPGRPLLDGGVAVSPPDRPYGRQSLIGIHSPNEGDLAGDILPLIRETRVRSLGSSTLHLAYTAVGIIDGVVDHNVRVWDIAAAAALALAAGCQIRFFAGGPFPLRRFELQAPRCPFFAARPAVARRLQEIYG